VRAQRPSTARGASFCAFAAARNMCWTQNLLAHQIEFSHKKARRRTMKLCSLRDRGCEYRQSILFYDRSKLEATFLPTGRMLQLDRVTEITESGLTAEMEVEQHWVFPMHFPSDPIFPGTLLIEAAGQAVAVWAWHAGLRGKPRLLKVAAKFKSAVLPSDRLVILTVFVQRRKNICLGTVDLSAGGRSVAEIRPMIIVLPG